MKTGINGNKFIQSKKFIFYSNYIKMGNQKGFSLFFLFLLFSSTFCVSLFQKYPINYSSKRNIFKVLAEVRSKIQAGGAFSSVIQLLDDLRSEILSEQSTHDAVAKEQDNECNTEIEFRSKEISDANNALSEGKAQLTSCQDSLSRAQTELANNVLNQQNINEQKEEIESLRKDENAVYLQRVKDHEEAVETIDVALELLDEIFSGEESLVQLSKLSTKMLKNSIKIKSTKDYAAVISVLAQIASQKVVLADTVTLEKVRQLLTTLKNNIESSLADYLSREKSSVEDFNERMENIENSLTELSETEASLREQINSFENCVAIQTGIINSANSKLDRNNGLLSQAQTMCENFMQEYEDSTAKR